MTNGAADKMYCPACGVTGPVEKVTSGLQETVQCGTCGLALETSEVRPYEPIGDILFADDSDLLRVALEDMLLEKGLARAVIPTRNGHEFLKMFTERLARKQPVDLLMLDVAMPVLNGFNAAIALRAIEEGFGLPRPTPLMFFSAQPCDEKAKKVLQFVGRSIYVNKVASPNLAELAARVHQVLVNLITKSRS